METQNFSKIYKSKIGYLKIVSDGESITNVGFSDGKEESKNSDKIVNECIKQLEEYFAGKRTEFNIKLNPKGTEFQKSVWKELTNIPYGQTKSYKQVATLVGNDKASRAVGNANNKNPIAIIVPCHRVIGANKKLVGYAGGLDVKEQLLELEK